MFNDLDDAFGALRDRAPRPLFAPATVVRRHGRRRTHRQIAVAGIAVVGVVAGAGALATGPLASGRGEPAAGASTSTSAAAPASSRPGKGGPPASPAGPSLDAIRGEFPDRLFLRPDDLPGMTYRNDTVTMNPTWPTSLMCEGFADDWYSSLPLARPGRQYGYAKEAPNAANMGSGGPYGIQTVRRYRDDGAQKMIANIDAFQACRMGRGADDRELARDFGGDASRLYVIPPFDPISDLAHHLVYVRVGDLVTEVDLYGLVDDAKARMLAGTIADRLRNL